MNPYQTTINNQPYDLMNLQKVTWKGKKDIVSFENAAKWVLHGYDGSKLEVDPKTLDEDADYLIKEIVFPG